MLKKLICFVAVIAMVVTSLPSVVFASEDESPRVEYLQGSVHVYRAGGNSRTNVYRGMSIYDGDIFVTGRNSSVTLAYYGQILVVGELTTLSVNSIWQRHGRNDSSISLVEGMLKVRVDIQLDDNSRNVVQAAGTMAGVRGTKYIMIYRRLLFGDEGVTDGNPFVRMLVIDGAVVVDLPDPDQVGDVASFLVTSQGMQRLVGDIQGGHSYEDVETAPEMFDVPLEAVDLTILEAIRNDPAVMAMNPELFANIDEAIERRILEDELRLRNLEERPPPQIISVSEAEEILPNLQPPTEPETRPEEPIIDVPSPTEPTTVASTESAEPTTTVPTTAAPEPTTSAPTTEPVEPTTSAPTTEPVEPTTSAPTTEPEEPTTVAPTTEPVEPTTVEPTTEPEEPTTVEPTTEPEEPTTSAPTTEPTEPTTSAPTTEPEEPTTTAPTEPTTTAPTTTAPTTAAPTVVSIANINNPAGHTPISPANPSHTFDVYVDGFSTQASSASFRLSVGGVPSGLTVTGHDVEGVYINGMRRFTLTVTSDSPTTLPSDNAQLNLSVTGLGSAYTFNSPQTTVVNVSDEALPLSITVDNPINTAPLTISNPSVTFPVVVSGFSTNATLSANAVLDIAPITGVSFTGHNTSVFNNGVRTFTVTAELTDFSIPFSLGYAEVVIDMSGLGYAYTLEDPETTRLNIRDNILQVDISPSTPITRTLIPLNSNDPVYGTSLSFDVYVSGFENMASSTDMRLSIGNIPGLTITGHNVAGVFDSANNRRVFTLNVLYNGLTAFPLGYAELEIGLIGHGSYTLDAPLEVEIPIRDGIRNPGPEGRADDNRVIPLTNYNIGEFNRVVAAAVNNVTHANVPPLTVAMRTRHYVLRENIVLPSTANNWTPVARFSGIFDGAGHTISGINVHITNVGGAATVDNHFRGRNFGMFERIEAGGIVENLGLRDINFRNDLADGTGGGNTSMNSGGIAGENFGIIRNSFVSCGTMSLFGVTLDRRIGGIVGTNHPSGQVHNTYAAQTLDITVGGNIRLGGIAGRNQGIIRDSVVLIPSIVSGAHTGRISAEHMGAAQASGNFTRTNILNRTENNLTAIDGEGITEANISAVQAMLDAAHGSNAPDLSALIASGLQDVVFEGDSGLQPVVCTCIYACPSCEEYQELSSCNINCMCANERDNASDYATDSPTTEDGDYDHPVKPDDEDDDSYPAKPDDEDDDSYPAKPDDEDDDSYPAKPDDEDDDSYPVKPDDEDDDNYPVKPDNEDGSYPAISDDEYGYPTEAGDSGYAAEYEEQDAGDIPNASFDDELFALRALVK